MDWELKGEEDDDVGYARKYLFIFKRRSSASIQTKPRSPRVCYVFVSRIENIV